MENTPQRQRIGLKLNVYEQKRLNLSSWNVELVRRDQIEKVPIRKRVDDSIQEKRKQYCPIIKETAKLQEAPKEICKELDKLDLSTSKETDDDTASSILEENFEIIKVLRSNYHQELEKRLEQENKNQKLTEALNVAQNKMTTLSEENKKLRAELENTRRKGINQLVHETKTKIKDLETRLEYAVTKINDYEKERENLWQEIRHLNDERDSFIHEEECIKEMRDFEYNDKSDAYTKIKLLHKTISTLRQKVDQLECRSKTLRRSGRGFERENKLLRKEKEDMKNKIIELNRNIYEKVNKLNATPNGILCKLKKKNRQSLMVDEIMNELRRAFLFCLK